jgi:hypothetical protein
MNSFTLGTVPVTKALDENRGLCCRPLPHLSHTTKKKRDHSYIFTLLHVKQVTWHRFIVIWQPNSSSQIVFQVISQQILLSQSFRACSGWTLFIGSLLLFLSAHYSQSISFAQFICSVQFCHVSKLHTVYVFCSIVNRRIKLALFVGSLLPIYWPIFALSTYQLTLAQSISHLLLSSSAHQPEIRRHKTVGHRSLTSSFIGLILFTGFISQRCKTLSSTVWCRLKFPFYSLNSVWNGSTPYLRDAMGRGGYLEA